MTTLKRSDLSYKHILVSPENHRRLGEVGKKYQTFDQIITELIQQTNTGNGNDAVGLQGNRIGAQTPVAPEPKEEFNSDG